jgi:predicted short-subunit dehydrogenase-like oxidoreductase (DUF2520 family)
MGTSHHLGLLGGGRVSKSFLVRLRRLPENLGPVKASSHRLASRIANTIHAGYPVAEFEDLNHCREVLIYLPDAQLGPALEELQAAELDWAGKVVILCDSNLDSSELRGLAERGAAVASLNPLEGFEDRQFLVEGDRPAVRAARRLIEDHETKVIEIQTAEKSLLAAGLVFATSLFTPLAAAGVDCLRKAGVRSGPAAAIVERLVQKSLRGYIKAGRKSWGGPFASRDQDAVLRQLKALFRSNPLLASYYTESALFALQLFRQDSEWLRLLTGERAAGASG